MQRKMFLDCLSKWGLKGTSGVLMVMVNPLRPLLGCHVSWLPLWSGCLQTHTAWGINKKNWKFTCGHRAMISLQLLRQHSFELIVFSVSACSFTFSLLVHCYIIDSAFLKHFLAFGCSIFRWHWSRVCKTRMLDNLRASLPSDKECSGLDSDTTSEALWLRLFMLSQSCWFCTY